MRANLLIWKRTMGEKMWVRECRSKDEGRGGCLVEYISAAVLKQKIHVLPRRELLPPPQKT